MANFPALNTYGSGSATPIKQPVNAGVMKTSTPQILVHPTASAPVSKQITTSADGTKQETHYVKPATETSKTAASTPTKVASSTTPNTSVQPEPTPSYPPATPIPPQTNNQQAVSGLLNIGQGNNNSYGVNSAQTGLIDSGNRAANIASEFGKQYADAGIQGANAGAGYRTTGTSPIGEGNANVIAQTTAAKQSAISAGQQAALQGLSQQQGAYSSAGGLAQGQQAQNIGALGNAGSLSQPATQFGVLTDPQTGLPISRDGGINSAIQGGIIQGKQGAAQSMEQAYQQGLANIRAADNIGPQIASTLLANPNLNQTPISAITNLNQWLSGQTSDPSQQQLATQVASYVKALGLTPEAAASIAVQKGATIGTLLKTLRDSVAASNEGQNPSNLKTSTGGKLNASSQAILDKYGIK